MNTQRQALTRAQIELLKFIGNRNISDNELNDIKLIFSQYYLKKADLEMEGVWKERKLSADKIEKILNTLI